MFFAIKKTATICFLFLSIITVSAQKELKAYKEEAEGFRKEVWGWDKPEFKVRNTPSEYANASTIILARHLEINADSKKKATMKGELAIYRQYTITEIAREAVKINDKAALTDYSEISFTQMTQASAFVTSQKTTTFVGVRIIKPDGRMTEVSGDDVVYIKDEKREKEAKVAIPDLQVGDIIDYFIAKRTTMSQDGYIPPYTFLIFDDVPVMHYSVHIESSKKYAVEYRCYNNAPDFIQSLSPDGDNILDLKKTNIPPYHGNNFWTSTYRQLPLIRMNIIEDYKSILGGRKNAREMGKVYRNQDANEFVEDKMVRISGTKKREKLGKSDYSYEVVELSDHLKSFMKKSKGLSMDSILAELFYIYRFAICLDYYSYSDVSEAIVKSRKELDPDYFPLAFGEFLKDNDIKNKLVFVTSKYSPRFTELMNSYEIDYLLLVEDKKPLLFALNNFYTTPFTVPHYYEDNKQVLTVDTKGIREFQYKDYVKGSTDLPGSDADDNTRHEKLSVAIPSTDGTLVVQRTTTLKGHYKADEQRRLILFEDYCNAERKAFNLKKTLIDEYAGSKRTKTIAEDMKATFARERAKQKDAFLDEAKDWFEQDVTDLSDYKIENMGVRHNNPDFVYSSKFNMSGLVKKAGNNLIVEVGKLQGSPLDISKDQRNRKLDIYMPFARSLQSEITIQIPDGYTVEGIGNLNKKVENETGYFIAEATSDGKAVTIQLKKSYNHAFEPAANWDKLLDFIDAANEWTNAKLLLKKK